MTTKIPWVVNEDGTPGETWNPVVGCSHASPGCASCYAERMARRLRAMGRLGYVEAHDGNGWTGKAVCLPERLDEPLRWRKPRRVFVCSMGDLFHPTVPDEFIGRVWVRMLAAKRHTFQVLTKRPERMARYLAGFPGYSAPPWIWLGTTVEDQQRADERIPHLLRCPAAVRFVSCEPLLGPVDLRAVEMPDGDTLGVGLHSSDETWARISWVIAGGESGPDARPMHPAWARSLRDQCRSAGTAFFYKQDGGLHGGGHLLDGREWREVPDAR